MPVDADHIVTAVTSAARLLTEEFADRPCLVVNDGDLSEDLPGVPIVGVDRADRAEVALLGGAGPDHGSPGLESGSVQQPRCRAPSRFPAPEQ